MNELSLSAKVKALLEEFTERLKDLYKDSLRSVVLYGSASSGEFSEGYSNINVMVVLDDTSLEALSKARPMMISRRFGMISAVFFTERYIKSSLDVFPIEFLDIAENHTVLYGPDPVEGLDVDLRNLRFQCEQELKSKLINIRKLYLSAAGKAAMEDLLFKSFTSLVHLMRNMLRLKGLRPPYPKEEIPLAVEKAFGIDPTVLNKILWAKNKKMALTRKDVDALLAALVTKFEETVLAVDRL